MTLDEIVAGLEAADGRGATIAAFEDVAWVLGDDTPEDFHHHVSQAIRSGSDARAMGYLLLAAMTLGPEGCWWTMGSQND